MKINNYFGSGENPLSFGGYYKILLDKVYDRIKSVGEISFEDLRNWAKGEGIGLATLTVILNDLLKEGKISAPQGFIEVEDLLCNFPVPKVISIMTHSREASKVRHEDKVTSDIVKSRVEELKKSDVDWMKDPDLKRSIEYLNKYRSVGVIRFLRDLSDMGVSNPEGVLKKLISLGYVDYSHFGVVNASQKLPKIPDKRLLSEYI